MGRRPREVRADVGRIDEASGRADGQFDGLVHPAVGARDRVRRRAEHADRACPQARSEVAVGHVDGRPVGRCRDPFRAGERDGGDHPVRGEVDHVHAVVAEHDEELGPRRIDGDCLGTEVADVHPRDTAGDRIGGCADDRHLVVQVGHVQLAAVGRKDQVLSPARCGDGRDILAVCGVDDMHRAARGRRVEHIGAGAVGAQRQIMLSLAVAGVATDKRLGGPHVRRAVDDVEIVTLAVVCEDRRSNSLHVRDRCTGEEAAAPTIGSSE